MDNYKDLEESNREVERSKIFSHETENPDDKKENLDTEIIADKNDTQEAEGSGIFTADGKELPEIEGGYDLIEPGGSLGDDEFVSA